MKFRNKKTGEIIDLSKGLIMDSMNGREIILKSKGTTYGETYGYHSLAELCAEWEDYKPAEPLIKGEKIRKAVRAWAEANDIDSKRLYDAEVKFDASEHRLRWIETNIEFNDIKGLEKLADGAEYSIDELCGEEEE